MAATCGQTWESFPKRERGYLVADEARSQALRQRIAGDGRIVIGLSWISKAPIGGEQKSARLADFESPTATSRLSLC